MPRQRATYHSDDWLRQLERGQAGAAFFRWWWDQNIAPVTRGRGALFHTGFDPADVVPVEEKSFLNEGGNLPDFAFVRRQDMRAEAGNVIASFPSTFRRSRTTCTRARSRQAKSRTWRRRSPTQTLASLTAIAGRS